jgi:hypothetical protein
MFSVFLSGAFMMSLLVAGTIFLRTWRDSRDPLFFHFAIAFWLMAIERVPLALFHKMKEPGSLIYLLRLAGFLFILVGIFRKNRQLGGGGKVFRIVGARSK